MDTGFDFRVGNMYLNLQLDLATERESVRTCARL